MFLDGVFDEKDTGFKVGVIAHVDPEKWTVDVQIESTGQTQFDIPIMSPYFYGEKGQGAYFIPESGARCIICVTNDTYFVLGYLPPVDVNFINASSEHKETESLSEEFLSGASKNLSKQEDSRRLAYRARREGDMVQGDYCFKTRASNKIKIFSNGNILHEASKLCFRMLSQLKDFIIDVCVNYTMRTPGGEIRWTNDDSNGESNYRREYKKKVTDGQPSIIELIGYDGSLYQFTIQDREGIPNTNGGFDVAEHFQEHIADDGEWDRRVNVTNYVEHVVATGNWNRNITSVYSHNIDILGNQTEELSGSRATTVHANDNTVIDGTKDTTVGGSYHMNASTIYINC